MHGRWHQIDKGLYLQREIYVILKFLFFASWSDLVDKEHSCLVHVTRKWTAKE